MYYDTVTSAERKDSSSSTRRPSTRSRMFRKCNRDCFRSVGRKNLTEMKKSWKWLLFGVITQFIHNIATNIAYYVHTPMEPLWDIGFQIFPEWEPIETLTEVLFMFCAVSTLLFMLLPSFIPSSNKITSMVIFVRLCKVSGCFILLRCISFLSTSLPSPSHHCRPNSTVYNPPADAAEIITRMDALTGCGDLVFSGHTANTLIMTLTVSTYAYYLLNRWWKIIAFAICVPIVIALAICIIIAQNHYTLDVVVALYTVPLLYYFLWKVSPDFEPEPKHHGTNVSIVSEASPHVALVVDSK